MWTSVDNALTPPAGVGKPMPLAVENHCGQMCIKTDVYDLTPIVHA